MGDLYEDDFLLWSESQATLLRRLAAGERVNDRDLDWANLGEEIEAVGRGELRAFEALLTQAIVHRLDPQCWQIRARFRTGTARKSASGRRRPMRSRHPCGSGLIWGGSTGGPCSVCPRRSTGCRHGLCRTFSV